MVQEGHATFTAGDDRGERWMVPTGAAHKFVNSETGRLRRLTYAPATGLSPSGSKTDRIACKEVQTCLQISASILR